MPNNSTSLYCYLLKMPAYLLMVILLSMLLGIGVFAQTSNTTNDDVHELSVVIKERYFNEQQLNTYKNNTDYLYDRPPPNPSLWQQLNRKFWDVVRQLLPEHIPSESFRYLEYFLLIVALVLIVMALLKANVSQLFFKRGAARRKSILHEVLPENINEINFDDRLAKALQHKNYRKATRLYYLQVLKKLHDAQLINWQLNKTNNAYITELQNTALYSRFKHITFVFDHVWYGNFPLHTESFIPIKTDFEAFLADISTIEVSNY